MKDYFSVNFAYIKHINGLKISELVDIIGMKNSTVSNLVNGSAVPNAHTLIKISDYFNYSIDDLLRKDIAKQGVTTKTAKGNVRVDVQPVNKETTEAFIKEIELMDARIEALNKTISVYDKTVTTQETTIFLLQNRIKQLEK